MDYTLESFISFCDEMQIADESNTNISTTTLCNMLDNLMKQKGYKPGNKNIPYYK